MPTWKPAKDFANANPVVREWHQKVAERKAPSTAALYLSHLKTFWDDNDSNRHYPNIAAWLERVRSDQQSPDNRVRNRWAEDLETFILSPKCPIGSRRVIATAVKSFLGYYAPLNKYPFVYGTKEDRIREAQRKEELGVLKPRWCGKSS